MALRFRKSFKLAPGVRMNVSASGMSWNLGPRGASVSIGKRGTYLNASLPGTGLSSRTRLDRPSGASSSRAPAPMVTMKLTLDLSDEGEMRYLDQAGNEVPAHIIAEARRQQGDKIRQMLETKCDEMNANIAALGQLHWDTPDPTVPVAFVPPAFTRPPPSEPEKAVVGFSERLIPGRRQAVDAENSRRRAEYEAQLSQFEQEKSAHDGWRVQNRILFSSAIAGNPEPMQQLLERRLGEIVWPKETLIAIDVRPDGRVLSLDVDLPEVQDIPTKRASLPARSWELALRDVGEVATRRLYQAHIHSLGFRVVGEAFAALPTVHTIEVSGYSQRADKATGTVSDEYLYSARIDRGQWSGINFAALEQVDPVEAFTRFELLRNMSATGVFKPVVPISVG